MKETLSDTETKSLLLDIESKGYVGRVHNNGVHADDVCPIFCCTGRPELGAGTIEFTKTNEADRRHTDWSKIIVLDSFYYDPNTSEVIYMTMNVLPVFSCMPCVTWEAVPLDRFVEDLNKMFFKNEKPDQPSRALGWCRQTLRKFGL